MAIIYLSCPLWEWMWLANRGKVAAAIPTAESSGAGNGIQKSNPCRWSLRSPLTNVRTSWFNVTIRS
ncbi:hypothetical protein T01_15235 [Trichinella spiralis]|uniref:Uncharacterized protein n=1 Tax=Trichinella spiralis TaxID=6334 RepID=A0A0V0Z6Z6_TRISP|nr:hypothetical protein T01_15235 [Trichinella spiralis]